MKDIKRNLLKINLPELKEKQSATINALPEYEIRTMKDDLAKLGLEKLEKEATFPPLSSPPEELPVFKMPLESSLPAPPAPTPPTPAPPTPIPLAPTLLIPAVPKKIKPKSKILPILIIIIIILVGLGGIFYWQNKKNPPLPPIEEAEEPELSESLISVEKTKILSLTPQDSVFELLKQESQISETLGSFKRIVILKNPPNNEQAKFLSLIDFLKELEINISPYVLAELKENYTLILYSQNGKSHLGLVAEIKNISNLQEQLLFWEQTMVNDLKNFFLVEKPGTPATAEFQNNIYNNISIRYINLPEPDITIDYALTDNLFILLTSKKSMYEAVNTIVDNL